MGGSGVQCFNVVVTLGCCKILCVCLFICPMAGKLCS
jgi:hypothetical protein